MDSQTGRTHTHIVSFISTDTTHNGLKYSSNVTINMLPALFVDIICLVYFEALTAHPVQVLQHLG